MSLEALLADNARFLENHRRLRVYGLFTDGTLENPKKREMLLACTQVVARHFQTMLFARQSHCDDARYRPIFLRHLREEIGHDELLAKERGQNEEVWDPILEAGAAWLTSRMMILDNVEKLAVIHLVLETAGAHMGSVTKKTMGKFGPASYFELHDEVDQSHVTLAIEPLRRQSPETLARVRVVLGQAWRVFDMWIDRIYTLVLEAE